MSYTSGAAMDQRGLRDVERWRDKIEVRLDNRQVFFLFFGSALVACLLFVLGVIVGKRLESRGRAIAPEVEDPLALLDKVATTPRTTQTPAVTFPQALFGGKNAQNTAKKTDLKLVASEPIKVEPKASEPKPAEIAKAGETGTTAADKAAAKPTNGKLVAKLDAQPTKPVVASKPAETKPAPAAGKVVAAPTVAPTPAQKAVPAAPASKIVATEPATAKGPVPVIGASATDSAKGKQRFTLQLSSFQDRSEAEAFAGKLGAEKTFITASEIPGKGTWYRVRVGDFGSAKDAIAGKLAFEKKHGVIAYVTQR
jgi:DedD protein